nr:MAG TPA: hypothetical protein [Caudoviricetes sp.]
MHLDRSVLARPPRAVGNGDNVSPEARHSGYGITIPLPPYTNRSPWQRPS